MESWLLETWYGGGRRGWLLLPLAWLFAAAAGLRRFAYRRGLLARYRSQCAVAIVGNLTAGGTGKTPLVIWLARELAARGLRIGVASRGYRAPAGAARLVTAADDAAMVGDEPLLLSRRLGVPVAIAARRADAVRLLEPTCDLVISDDGLQHYALERDLEIAVVDGSRGLGNGLRLPAGPLREARSRLDNVAAVVVNGAGFAWPGAIQMTLQPTAAVALADQERRPLASFAGKRVRAVAAIGNPQRFFAMLREHGLAVDEHPLPDHAAIPRELLDGNGDQALLMTEKDAVKCTQGGLRHAWYVEVDAHIEGTGADDLMARIVGLVKDRKPGA